MLIINAKYKLPGVFLFLILLSLWGCSKKVTSVVPPVKIDFDWQFHLGDVENGQSLDMDIVNWKMLDLPHDWSIEGEYSQNNSTDWESGFLSAGIGWYRKTLKWEYSWKNKQVKIHFEGVYLNSDVWINGHHLGHRPNGYIGFEYDLTDYLLKGDNIIAVRVDQSKPLTGRWYTGSGIYRHVWLKVQEPVHIGNWGVSFVASNISTEKSDFEIEVKVNNENESDEPVQVAAILLDENGNRVANVEGTLIIASQTNSSIKLTGEVVDPKLWSPESPYLYTLKTKVIKGTQILDENELKVGFRKIEFSGDFGFKLNRKITKMKGVCDHHTAGSVGSAVPDDVLLYRLRLLKKMGCNAIRTAHNPFSPAFYNICDSLGIMVLDEFLDGWGDVKAEHDYGLYFKDWWKTDGIDFIKRDRNHPCVVLWSIGNEVSKGTREEQKELVDLFHEYDQTRTR